MENINVKINRKTRNTFLSRSVIGNDGENLQENLVFTFDDEFVEGQARLELIMPDKTLAWFPLTQVEETYQLPVKSIMTKIGKILMQVVIDEGTDQESIPIFKSNIFPVICNKSINAPGEEPPEGYASWLEIANTKLNQMDNFDIDAVKEGNTSTVTITNRFGIEKSVEILDGEPGQDGVTPTIGNNGNWYLGDIDTGKPSRGEQGLNGQDAKINGYNTLEIVAGNNIIIEQVGNRLIISATGGLPDNHLETSDGNVFMTSDNAYFIVKESD